jgi:hypothetical protein
MGRMDMKTNRIKTRLVELWWAHRVPAIIALVGASILEYNGHEALQDYWDLLVAAAVLVFPTYWLGMAFRSLLGEATRRVAEADYDSLSDKRD